MWETRQEMAFIDMTSSAGYSMTHKHTNTPRAAFFMSLIEKKNEKSVMQCFLNQK